MIVKKEKHALLVGETYTDIRATETYNFRPDVRLMVTYWLFLARYLHHAYIVLSPQDIVTSPHFKNLSDILSTSYMTTHNSLCKEMRGMG